MNEEIGFLNYLDSSEKILKEILRVCAKIKAYIREPKHDSFETWSLNQNLYNLRDLLSIPSQEIDDISYSNFSEIKYPMRKIIFTCLDIMDEITKNKKYNPKPLEKRINLSIEAALKIYSDTKKKHKVSQPC
ncbi:MAG: hypothetical protein HY776_08635 [Actinobacteria bacterium]|nr:hypothetical protein [Actinomycetota bacterium]